jgi:glycosyltransferase involved in cell wall biosynthesis
MGGTVLQVAPVLPEDARQQAQALAETGQLHRLVTSWVPRRAARSWVRGVPLLGKLERRYPPPVGPGYVRRVIGSDLVDRATRWLGGSSVDAADRRFAAVDRAAMRLVEAPIRIVLGREDGCLASFRCASTARITRLYDLPTAHYATAHRLLRLDMDLFPYACAQAQDPREFATERVIRKEAELTLADRILCASAFVRASLIAGGVKPEKIHVLPFGAPPEWLTATVPRREPVLLHVGQISLRKGVHRVLLAWKRLKAYRTHRLRLIGDMHLSRQFLNQFSGLYEHVAPMPRAQLQNEYARAQALILNALADGFGLVFLEAMSLGTPVLVSRNSGAEGFLSDGGEARLFDYGDDDGLMAALDWSLTHPKQLGEMGRRARQKAASWTWVDYRREFAKWIQRLSTEESNSDEV